VFSMERPAYSVTLSRVHPVERGPLIPTRQATLLEDDEVILL
jgi:hypothetical protein